MEPNQNPTNNYQPTNTPVGGGSVPPPPQQEVNVRTLASDVSSMQEGGGSAPLPRKVSPIEVAAAAPGASGGPSHGGTWGWVWLVVVALIVVAGLGYYYFFYMSDAIPEESPNDTVATEEYQEVPSQTQGEIEYSALLTALQSEASQPLPAGNFKEIALVNENNQIISFSNLLKTVLPETAGSELEAVVKNNFEDALKAYLYYDEDGVWPVYGVMVRGDAVLDVISLQNQLRALEETSISSFYLSSPGVASHEFKDGQVKSFPTRYQSFSQAGASFNYGLINGQLYLSTSYNALKNLVQ